uniref:Insect cytokine uENF1 n=1 Tax=Samia pryeri TaxID=3116429 RepID=E1CEG0_9NEOP|nr:insect cytokine precursor uENF1 [Samia cynthia pryeri]
MSSVVDRLLVYSIVFNLFICAYTAPFSVQDILDVFGSPIKDFKETFSSDSGLNKTNTAFAFSSMNTSVSTIKSTMIEVPPNAESCKQGTYLDNTGVCRIPW